MSTRSQARAAKKNVPAPGYDPAVDPLLDIRDLHVGFRTSKTEVVPAVQGASLTVYPGQTVAIVGESGSGKSTTAHAVIDLLPGRGEVTGGQILFEGRDVSKARKDDIVAMRGSSVGLVPQDPMSNLNPLWKVGFQIKEALEANGVAKGKEADRRVVELLEEAGLPDAERRAQQYPHEFSGGMRQRALIAMGLAARPKLLIADEPTSALDVTVQKQILDHLEMLTGELGVAVLLITHDLGLAAERADHLVVMYKGKIVESGPALEILQHPEHPYTQRLVSKAPSLASQRLSARKEREEVKAHAVQTAGEIAAELEQAEEVVGDVTRDDVITVQNLTKVFKLRGKRPGQKIDFTAVDDVSFSLRRGTTTAIVGESGSGKSTVARMVLDLLEPTSGTVLFDGVDVRTLKGKEQLRLRRRMQPVFQNPYASLDPLYSVYQSIEEPLSTHGIGSKKEREARVRDLLDKVSLPTSVMPRFPSELSGGQRQRVAIARALALQPEVVICDEAVSALDVLVQAQILELLNELQADLGLSYLFITHDLAVVRQIADDVIVMEKGKAVEQASVDEVFSNPTQAYTRKLLDAIPGGSIELGR
ncbi:dipeptide ABC transporter ATP-binding protein [Aeromicrobium massiliense]|uniref:dipeptide ABC transporter ATP-binding protein n=1 Tax=Aeromicrobium massiliense TaxID=1464554 RepID=UPI0002F003C7|nr:ABC transporter ATP-binding protein [Aeromicrobium massiliense]